MKNRLSLTLVLSLLVCGLAASVSAQTNPGVLKPENSTLYYNIPTDGNVQPALTPQRFYTVVPEDKVYLQIGNVKLRSNNLPLYPYFYLYGKSGDNWEYISGTSSQAGNQICKEVKYPSKFNFYIDNTYKECFINVYSEWHTGNQLVARGATFKTDKLLKWADNPQNDGKTYNLEISKGNTIELKKSEIRKNRYYYFEIVSYKIAVIDNEYKKYLYESYKSWLITQQEGAEDKWLYYYDGDKKYVPAAKAEPDYSEMTLNCYDKPEREILVCCTENKKITFTIENKTGTLDTIELSTNDVVKQLNDCMKKYPDDHRKWVVKVVSKQHSEIELNFAGIRRVYCITTISIPKVHSKHEILRYIEKGYAPWMRVYIQQNGVPCGLNCEYARTGRRAWDCDVPNDKYNRFEIREGIKARFSLQIKDADTWFYEIALVEVSGITDRDFAKGIVYEKVDSMSNDDRQSTIQFEEVKE